MNNGKAAHWRDPSESFHQAAVANALDGFSAQGNPKPTAESETKNPWPPPLDAGAFHGLAGDVVSTISPHSEADPAALLIQFLVAFGSVVGRAPHFAAEADRHGCNLFCVLVGATAKGRKGTSWGQIRRLFEPVDKEWSDDRVKTGLASGEGLIHHIRDELRQAQPIREKKIVKGFEVTTTDPGVSDKRLLVVEPEFGRVLQVCEREKNVLSATLRQAWDGIKLQNLTKTLAATATDPHVSIIGHITADELRRLLSDTQAANGFANRILWTCVKRSKLLPEGGRLNDADLQPLQDRIEHAVRFARQMGEMRRTAEARDIWHEIYGPLSAGRPGLLGAVISRAEAQVMRLAMIYALLDYRDEIDVSHLAAGVEVWAYCEGSAQFVFGDALGDQSADLILDTIRRSQGGLTRTEIRDLFGRHKPTEEISRALGVLLRAGLARPEREESGGRPVEKWYANAT